MFFITANIERKVRTVPDNIFIYHTRTATLFVPFSSAPTFLEPYMHRLCYSLASRERRPLPRRKLC